MQKKIEKEINREDLNTFFFNLALAHLNSTILYAKSKLTKDEFSNFFICITCNDDENEEDSCVQEFGFYMFRFFITRKNNQFKFSEKIKKYPVLNIDNYPVIKNTLKDLNLLKTINVHSEKWIDQFGNQIQRFYFIYK